MKKVLLLLLALTFTLYGDAVYSKTYNAPIAKIYPQLLNTLDNTHLVVVSEINILQKFKQAGLPEKFGKDFNTNKLTAIKAIIACNGWFGNAIANSDPTMMAFCPIRLTVIEQDGKTSILYVRSSLASKTSKAYPVLQKLEQKVIKAIESLE